MRITYNKNSILNPDEVQVWAESERAHYSPDKAKRMIADRAERAAALLPNVRRYMSEHFDRAQLAVEKWEDEVRA